LAKLRNIGIRYIFITRAEEKGQETAAYNTQQQYIATTEIK